MGRVSDIISCLIVAAISWAVIVGMAAFIALDLSVYASVFSRVIACGSLIFWAVAFVDKPK